MNGDSYGSFCLRHIGILVALPIASDIASTCCDRMSYKHASASRLIFFGIALDDVPSLARSRALGFNAHLTEMKALCRNKRDGFVRAEDGKCG